MFPTNLVSDGVKPTRQAIYLDDQDNLILEFDASTLEKWQRCPQEFSYYTTDNIEKNQTKQALIAGRAFHAAMDVRGFYEHQRSCGQLIDEAEMYSRQVAAIHSTFAESSDLDPDDYRSPSFVISVIELYNAKHNVNLPDCTILTNAEDAPCVEIPFAYELALLPITPSIFTYCQHRWNRTPTSVRCIYTGRIDCLISIDGVIWVRDHKTTSVGGQGWLDSFVLSPQMLGYTYIASKLLSQPVRGLQLNGVIWRRPTKTGKSIEFTRQLYPYSPSHLDEWYINTLQSYKTILHCLTHIGYPRHSFSCIRKYGTCEYFDLCISEPSIRPAMQQSSLFRPVTWTPFE